MGGNRLGVQQPMSLALLRGLERSADGVTACWRDGCRERPAHDHEGRRLRARRATKRSDWRGGRDGPSNSTSGPASGAAGDRGDDLACWPHAAMHCAKRRLTQASPRAASRPVRRAGPSVAYSRRTSRDRDPRARDGPRDVAVVGAAGHVVFAQGIEARRGETRDEGARLDAKHESPVTRSGMRTVSLQCGLPTHRRVRRSCGLDTCTELGDWRVAGRGCTCDTDATSRRPL